MKDMEILKIEETDIFLQELGPNQGKITVSNTYGYNYSYYWGSMGGTLKEFLQTINSEYFASKLLGAKNTSTIDVRKTFTQIRKYIRDDIRIQWYEHIEFQKKMRQVLNSFQRECQENESSTYFVDHFMSRFVNRIDFDMIEDRYDARRLEEDFQCISEPWGFIVEKDSPEYYWLKSLHVKIKNILLKIS